MSNVPRARLRLREALRCHTTAEMRKLIRQALGDMVREQPDFVSPPALPPLSRDQRRKAREMRYTGMPINDIARSLGTNIGRVSEALHE